MGPVVESARCNPAPGEDPPIHCDSGAPVDCKQVDWQDWSACSASCDVGHMTRRREVVQPPSFGGKDCKNPFEEINQCNVSIPCPDQNMDCQWGDWQEWADCDAMFGQRMRHRHVTQPKLGFGLDCYGPRQEVGNCSRTCKETKYFCIWNDWLPWSLCSKTCGIEGRIMRKRSLKLSVKPPPLMLDESRMTSVQVQQEFELLSQVLDGRRSRRIRELTLAFMGSVFSLAVVLGGTVRLSRCCQNQPVLCPAEEVKVRELRTTLAEEGQYADLELQT